MQQVNTAISIKDLSEIDREVITKALTFIKYKKNYKGPLDQLFQEIINRRGNSKMGSIVEELINI